MNDSNSIVEEKGPYFIRGISASGQMMPTMQASAKPGHVLSERNHINSAAANNM